MDNVYWEWVVDFFNDEHREIIRQVVIALAVTCILAIFTYVVSPLKRIRRYMGSHGKPKLETIADKFTAAQNKLHRPRFEFLSLSGFSNTNGQCLYKFVIENAGGLAYNVIVTSDDFEGSVNLRDMDRRKRATIVFNTVRPIYEVCLDFKFDLPDGSSSTSSLFLHQKTDSKWYAGGVGSC